MPLSLKTMEVQIKGDQWNRWFRTVQVYYNYDSGLFYMQNDFYGVIGA